jgi:hypothetical protein
MPNSEKNPTFFEIPQNDYSPEVEGSLACQPEFKAGEIIEFDQISVARQEVEESYEIDLPKEKVYEQIDDSVFGEMLDRGQQIYNARHYHLEKNPYKYPVDGQILGKKIVNSTKNIFCKRTTEARLIEKERKIGARVFQIPGFTFFMTDSRHWWTHLGRPVKRPVDGEFTEMTTHYEIMLMAAKAKVLKCTSEIHERNEFISGEELKNLNDAINIYHSLVMKELYGKQTNIVNIEDYLE